MEMYVFLIGYIFYCPTKVLELFIRSFKTDRLSVFCVSRSVDSPPSRSSVRGRSLRTTREDGPAQKSSPELWICSLTTLLLLNCWRLVHLNVCVREL